MLNYDMLIYFKSESTDKFDLTKSESLKKLSQVNESMDKWATGLWSWMWITSGRSYRDLSLACHEYASTMTMDSCHRRCHDRGEIDSIQYFLCRWMTFACLVGMNNINDDWYALWIDDELCDK